MCAANCGTPSCELFVSLNTSQSFDAPTRYLAPVATLGLRYSALESRHLDTSASTPMSNTEKGDSIRTVYGCGSTNCINVFLNIFNK